jgi:hypothetical protein
MKPINKLINNIFGIICIIGLIYFLNERSDKKRRINADPNFAIGRILSFRPYREGNYLFRSYTANDKGWIEFYYVFKGDTIKNGYDSFGGRIPEKCDCIGKLYLVVFNPNNLMESRILIDKPINDSLDFDNYILEFIGKKPID